MFFVLSKLLGLLVSPIVWIAGLMIAALVVKKAKIRTRLLIVGTVLLLFFSNAFILNEFLKLWEKPAISESQLKPSYNYGIVLSGMVWYNTDVRRVNFMRSSDRLWQAVKLYEDGRIQKILITGGSAEFFSKDTVESAVLRDFLVSVGIPPEDVITEERSRNTHENALFTAQLLQDKPKDNLLLITSAMHIRRANGCFRKAGLTCDIYPADQYSGARKFNIDQLLIPDAGTLFNWNAFFHELMGVISYKFMGYL